MSSPEFAQQRFKPKYGEGGLTVYDKERERED